MALSWPIFPATSLESNIMLQVLGVLERTTFLDQITVPSIYLCRLLERTPLTKPKT